MSEESNTIKEVNAAGFKRRRSALDSSYTALKYVSGLQRKQFRKSDKITDITVCVSLLLATLLIFCPPFLLKPQLIVVLDLLLLGTIITFIMKRLGILITLSERQAVLVWDLLVGSLVLGVLLCLNSLFVINYVSNITTKF